MTEVSRDRMQQSEGIGSEGASYRQDEISLADLFLTLFRHRRFIVGLTGLGTLLGLVVALLSPSLYRAQTKIVPSSFLSSGSELAGISPLRLAASQFNLGSLGGTPYGLSLLFPQVLSSRDFMLRILTRKYPLKDGQETGLPEYLGIKEKDPERRLQRTVNVMRSILKTTYDIKSGVTTISVTVKDPNLAAALANAAVEELDRFNRELKTTHAGETVGFIGKRLAEIQGQLTSAEETLKTFRDRNRQVLGSPQLMMEEARLLRDVATNEQLFITLKTQYEVARIEQAKNVPDIAVLEKAAPPVQRASPRRRRILVLWAVLSGCSSVVAVFAMEWIAGIRTRLAGTPSSG